MKKILTGLVLLLVLLVAVIYLFIPAKLRMEATVTINAPLSGVYRSLAGNNNWNKWWPGTTPFTYNNQTYFTREKIYNLIDIDISSNQDTINSRMNLISIKGNAMSIDWNAEQASSASPFKRLLQYRDAVATRKNMNDILQRMKTFMEKTENVYSLDIKQTKVVDSALVSTRRRFDHPPTVHDVYDMVRSLKNYIIQNNAVELNSPMLNVFQIDSLHYEAMTAIAVNRALPQTNEFAPKFLLKGGNILEAEVRGGPHKIETALRELDNYRTDYKLTSPAIPFQLLVIDRMKETDTANWITKLYYPVF
ncbi:MAG TPA: hypothetical protein VJ765_08595 [Chitinophagaceae bacterium]|nr:hypothetical protein [Chitinophagaceae bacterium]